MNETHAQCTYRSLQYVLTMDAPFTALRTLHWKHHTTSHMPQHMYTHTHTHLEDMELKTDDSMHVAAM